MPIFKQLSDRPHDYNATAGKDVVFKCNAYAIPDASVVWYRNGQEINRMLFYLIFVELPLSGN